MLSTLKIQDSVRRLRLVSVGPALVEFELSGDTPRPIAVRVASGSSWYRAVRFPNFASQAGETTGNEALDEEIRARAGEELVRLEASSSAEGRLVA